MKLNTIEIILLSWFAVLASISLYVGLFVLNTATNFSEIIQYNNMCFGSLGLGAIPILVYEAIQ